MAAAHFLILYLPILLSLHLCLFSCCLPLNYLLYFHVPFFNFYHSCSISIAQQSFYLGSTFSFSLYFYAFCLSLSISLSLSLYLSTVHFHLLCSSLLCHIFSFLVEFNFHLSVGSAFVARRLSFKSSNYFSFFKKDVIIQARARAACVWRAQISVTRCCQTKMPNFTDIAQKCSQIFFT